MFEIPVLVTDCSSESTTPSPAPAPAKNRDLGTFEPHAASELHDWSEPQDWAETLAASPLANAQARTNSKTTRSSIKHLISLPSAATTALRSSTACWLPSTRLPEATAFSPFCQVSLPCLVSPGERDTRPWITR